MDVIEAQEGLRAPRSLAESIAATPDPADLPFVDLDAWHAEELRGHFWEKRRWREAERERRERLNSAGPPEGGSSPEDDLPDPP